MVSVISTERRSYRSYPHTTRRHDRTFERRIDPPQRIDREVERVRMSKSFPAWRTKNADQSVPASSN
jgi:hypothetical protein